MKLREKCRITLIDRGFSISQEFSMALNEKDPSHIAKADPTPLPGYTTERVTICYNKYNAGEMLWGLCAEKT